MVAAIVVVVEVVVVAATVVVATGGLVVVVVVVTPVVVGATVVVVELVVVVYEGSGRLKLGSMSFFVCCSGSFLPSQTHTKSPLLTSVGNTGLRNCGMRMHPCDAGSLGTFTAPWIAMPKLKYTGSSIPPSAPT